jgi:hypothetical protein
MSDRTHVHNDLGQVVNQFVKLQRWKKTCLGSQDDGLSVREEDDILSN